MDFEERVRRAQAGDREAFAEIARRYEAGVRAMAFSRTGHREEAEDLAQEVWLHVWRKLPTLKEPSAFPGWLKQVAKNACSSWFRRARPWPESLDSDIQKKALPDFGPRPLEAALARERERAWRKALLAIPEANRHALLMQIWGGCSYEEIADFLDVPITTVEGRIHRAKVQLRRLLRSDASELLGESRRRWNPEGD